MGRAFWNFGVWILLKRAVDHTFDHLRIVLCFYVLGVVVFLRKIKIPLLCLLRIKFWGVTLISSPLVRCLFKFFDFRFHCFYQLGYVRFLYVSYNERNMGIWPYLQLFATAKIFAINTVLLRHICGYLTPKYFFMWYDIKNWIMQNPVSKAKHRGSLKSEGLNAWDRDDK